MTGNGPVIIKVPADPEKLFIYKTSKSREIKRNKRKYVVEHNKKKITKRQARNISDSITIKKLQWILDEEY